jgi:hypothetical protein
MHENREISCTSWSSGQDRSAKALNRSADMNVQDKSDCAVVPVNQPNKGEQSSTEAGEGRAQTGENIVPSCMCPTQSGTTGAFIVWRITGKKRMARSSKPLRLSFNAGCTIARPRSVSGFDRLC